MGVAIWGEAEILMTGAETVIEGIDSAMFRIVAAYFTTRY
jgi:hypothetical protein